MKRGGVWSLFFSIGKRRKKNFDQFENNQKGFAKLNHDQQIILVTTGGEWIKEDNESMFNFLLNNSSLTLKKGGCSEYKKMVRGPL